MPSNAFCKISHGVFAGLAGLLVSVSPGEAFASTDVPDEAPILEAEVSRTILNGPGAPSDVAFLAPASGTEQPAVLAARGEHGLAWLSLSGTELGRLETLDSSLVTALQDAAPPAVDAGITTLAASDALTGTIQLLRFDATLGSLTLIDNQAIALDDELTGLCQTFSALSRTWQLFGVTDAGMIHQWTVDPTGQQQPQLLRSITAGKGAGHCAVDASTRRLYLAHESQGVLTTGSEPESEPAFDFLALAEPWGPLSDELKGLALLPGETGSYLLVSDVGANRFVVLEADSGAVAGTFSVPRLGEGEGLASYVADGAVYLAIADEDDGPGSSAVVLLDGDQLAGSLDLQLAMTGVATDDSSAPAVLRPVTETAPVDSFGDAADDPAIWVHPTQPERSLVLGSEKQRGIYLYDLQGKALQFLPAGRINNVDLRDDFPLGGLSRTLVAGSDRTRKGIALFLLDGPAQRLEAMDSSFIATDLSDPYGLCLYRSARDGSFQVFVNDSSDGRTVQFRLEDDGRGGVRHERLRDIHVGTQAEGCVADDETGALFIAEEAHGIWQYSAEAEDGNERRLVDSFASGRIVPDVEGLAIWKDPNTGATPGGYLVASNQGRDSYLLYDRVAPYAYRGEFFVVAGDGIDGASETDGLAVTSANLGPDYPEGLVVVQDGRNLGPRERQNYKYLSWRDIREALSLD